MMGKKIISVFLAALLFSAGLLTACNGSGVDSDSNSDSSSTGSSSSVSRSTSAQSASKSDASSSGSFVSSTGSSVSSGVSASSSSKSSSIVSSSSKSSSASNSTVKTRYYIGASWNGYIPNDEFTEMTLVPGKPSLYTYTVTLTTEQRMDYFGTEGPGHWYKVTEGGWDPSYGIDNYCLQPAPVNKTADGTKIGLGSIWIDQEDGAPPLVLTIQFDSATKTVYDNYDGKTLPAP